MKGIIVISQKFQIEHLIELIVETFLYVFIILVANI